nr:ABC transporter substrate-binding protein [Nocardioides daedukensis]
MPRRSCRRRRWSQAYTFVQALKAAGDDPTRESIVEALEEKGGDFEGPALAPLRYSADSHMGVSGMQVVKLKNGTAEPLTGVLVTDIGDAPIEEASGGTATTRHRRAASPTEARCSGSDRWPPIWQGGHRSGDQSDDQPDTRPVIRPDDVAPDVAGEPGTASVTHSRVG